MSRPRKGKPALTAERNGAPRLIVRGFKSIRDETAIELRPLTLLAGANSSGKSSIVQPLLLLKQTLDVSYDPGPLLLSGANAKFAEFAQLLWHGKTGPTAREFSVGIEAGGRVDVVFASRAKHGVSLKAVVVSEGSHKVEVSEAMTRMRLPPASGGPAAREVEVRVRRDRFMLRVSRPVGSLGAESQQIWLPVRLPIGSSRAEAIFERSVRTLIHVPGLRGNPERTYPATEVGDHFPGLFQDYFPSIAKRWLDAKDDRLRQLGENLKRLGLSWKVIPERIDDTSVQVRVGRMPTPQQGGALDLVNLADVGLGVSQVLPVLVALLVARPGQLVYVEQPEIHLHPRAQVALGEILLEAARRGVIVVAETHSNVLLRAVQASIAEHREAELVALHWFRRDDEGATHVETGVLDEHGAYGDWPEDFAETELELDRRYLSA